MEASEHYAEATIKTNDSLRTIAHSPEVQELSSMSLPQIDSIVDLIARVTPAGNVPGVILNGLTRLPDRKLPLRTVRRDINLLFKGVEQSLKDTAVYSTFFAGPAAVIWAYQNLVKLAGKDLEAAFPEGTWQFYLDYALRDDTARHSNETHGFDSLLKKHHITLDPVDRLTAWTMAAIYCLHQYNALLENEWRERVYTDVLAQITQDEPQAHTFTCLYQEWERQRPYGRGADVAPQDDYPTYRRRHFDRFLAMAMQGLPESKLREWQSRVQAAGNRELQAYQRQMSILAYLDPGKYGETRVPVPLTQAHIGLLYQGRYYLLPACQPDSERPVDATDIRALITALLTHPAGGEPAQLQNLTRIRRATLPNLREKLNPDLRRELNTLRLAPILLNFDRRPADQPLAVIRQAERGVGDHPLTVFDTGQSFVFDQSHIFFDGAWGAALAEILTNEALAWGVYLSTLPPARPGKVRPYSPALRLTKADRLSIASAPVVMPEICVETVAVDLPAMLALRKQFKQRNDLLRLTVNDLLVLYRAFHAALYKPTPELVNKLRLLEQEASFQAAARLALEALEAPAVNPTVLIPVDASRRRPQDRVFPMTFEVPLSHLNLLSQHQEVVDLLEQRDQGKQIQKDAFEELQRTYLRTLAGFGEVLSKAKEIATLGESASVGSIKMLAHLPTPLQRLLDKIPGRFDVLNDIIKGREVFSNIGAVVDSSTLTRFMTSKDDNEKKMLAWGVMTTADGKMAITLRDFRPHVAALINAGRQDLASLVTQDYLDAYVNGLNLFVHELQRMIQTRPRRRLRFGRKR